MKVTGKFYQELYLEPDNGAVSRSNLMCVSIDQDEIVISTGTGDKGWFREGVITWEQLLNQMRAQA